MDIQIRAMRTDEKKEVARLAKRSFGIMEGLFIADPKTALVAVVDNEIVGGVFYHIKKSGAKKFGYIDILFTLPEFQGKGIGKRLSEECFRVLWEQNCDALITYVLGDNIPSWTQFVKNGFVQTSFKKMAQNLGIIEGLKPQILLSAYGFTMGYDFYIAFPDKAETIKYQRQSNTSTQKAYFVLANLFFTFIASRTVSNHFIFFIAFALLLFGSILSGYIATLFSKEKWQFRLNEGGVWSSLIAAIGHFWLPLNASWFPEQYKNTPQMRKELAFNSIATWVFLFLVAMSKLLFSDPPLLLTALSGISVMLLILRSIPFAPVSSYGAERVLQWNKLVWVLLTALTAFAYYIL